MANPGPALATRGAGVLSTHIPAEAILFDRNLPGKRLRSLGTARRISFRQSGLQATLVPGLLFTPSAANWSSTIRWSRVVGDAA
ncbi:MAG: hypothetical protein IPH76_03220 [Xanthomonadales bacterium]|nr:hypothetical protein [Xanthomonadales bacterium]